MTVPEQNSSAIALTLARVEVKLDSALALGKDHESRLRTLERKVWAASGLAGLGSGAVAAAIVGAVIRR